MIPESRVCLRKKKKTTTEGESADLCQGLSKPSGGSKGLEEVGGSRA